MAKIKKHVGRIKTTDSRCVVVYMQIPSDENYSLVVVTDTLPDMVHDALFRIVDSSEAYNEVELANLLDRRPSPEPRVTMLKYLHKTGRLRRIPVSSIVMYPYPNQPMPLEEIIKINGGKIDSKLAPDGSNTTEKFNPFEEMKRVEDTQSRLALATAKLKEAELLDFEANKKREEAYKYFPQLRPGYQEPISKSKREDSIPEIEVVDESAFTLEELGINPEDLGKEIILEDYDVAVDSNPEPEQPKRKKKAPK